MKIENRLGLVVLIMALMLSAAMSGCASTAAGDGQQASEKIKAETIPVEDDLDPEGGPDGYQGRGDNANSKYYVNPDFYNIKSDEQLTIISGFKTYQQSSWYSCGAASALMVLYNLGITDYNEKEIADLAGTTPDDGTTMKGLYNFFSNVPGIRIVETSYKPEYTEADLIAADDENYVEADRGNLPPTFSPNSEYASDNDPNTENWVEDGKDAYFVKWLTGNLSTGRAILVEWGDWDGHYQVIIGYDNNGTPKVNDDQLILADPFDSTDQWQDGYYVYPMERYFDMWQDRSVAPKPYQLQPYIIVEKAE
jgi:hypothetical protein